MFGRTAGVVAALALAVSPVSVAIDRDNNPDALFVLLLVARRLRGVRAVQDGRLRWLLATAVLIGLAFNTKMLVALVVLPGIGLAYLLFAPRTLARRGLAPRSPRTVALVAVSGAVDRRGRADAGGGPAVDLGHELEQRAQPGVRVQRLRPRDGPDRRHIDRSAAAACCSRARPARCA